MTKELLTNWFIEKIAEETALPKTSILTDQILSELKIDSLSTVTIAYDLEKELGVEIDPTIFYEFETIELLVGKIMQDKILNK